MATQTTNKRLTQQSTKPVALGQASSSACWSLLSSVSASSSFQTATRWTTQTTSMSPSKVLGMLSKVLQKPLKALLNLQQATKPSTRNNLTIKADPFSGVGFFASRASLARSVSC